MWQAQVSSASRCGPLASFIEIWYQDGLFFPETAEIPCRTNSSRWLPIMPATN
jgi:hypothetical protein